MPSILVKHFRGFTSIRAKHLRAIDRASLRIGKCGPHAHREISIFLLIAPLYVDRISLRCIVFGISLFGLLSRVVVYLSLLSLFLLLVVGTVSMFRNLYNSCVFVRLSITLTTIVHWTRHGGGRIP